MYVVLLEFAGLLAPPKTFVDVFALANIDEPNAFGGEAGVADPPPKIDAVLVALVLLLAPPPPKIFEVCLFAAVANILPADAGELFAADDAGVDDKLKLENGSDAFSTVFEPKIFDAGAG